MPLKKLFTFQNAIFSSKICVSSSFSLVDPTNSSFLVGLRPSLFFLSNPTLLKYSLKTTFLFLESFCKKDYKIIFIANLSKPTLFYKFLKICKKRNFFLLQFEELSMGFLTNKKLSKTLVITLFLDVEQTEFIQKLSFLRNLPIISFSNLSTNKNSSTISINANFSNLLAQNLIITLLIICLNQHHDNEKL